MFGVVKFKSVQKKTLMLHWALLAGLMMIEGDRKANGSTLYAGGRPSVRS